MCVSCRDPLQTTCLSHFVPGSCLLSPLHSAVCPLCFMLLLQVDWEAILATHPQQFITRLSEWFVPKAALPCAPVPTNSTGNGSPSSTKETAAAAAVSCNGNSSSSGSNGGSSGSGTVLLPEVESLPAVSEVLATFRQRLNALNGPDATPV